MSGDLEQRARSRVGQLLKGRYRLERVLGIGGMATVYEAVHRNRKRFAVKVLHTLLSVDESMRTRFLREGYVANSVGHPAAVAVLDDDVAEDGSAFLVMELLDGMSLDAAAEGHGGRLPLGLTVSVGVQLLDVLESAHTHGIVHRDLKPANLFLTRDGTLKVLDFGIARLHDETGGSATQTGMTMGTPAFMAPEQALGKSREIDGRTDLWATGATLFTLLSGLPVHEGETMQQVLVAAATQPARSVGTVVHGLPRPIGVVIDRALAFSKKDRWPSAAAMREALRRAGSADAAAVAPPGRPAPTIDMGPSLFPMGQDRGHARGSTAGTGSEVRRPPLRGATTAGLVSSRAGLAAPRKGTLRGVLLGSAATILAVGGASTFVVGRSPAANLPSPEGTPQRAPRAPESASATPSTIARPPPPEPNAVSAQPSVDPPARPSSPHLAAGQPPPNAIKPMPIPSVPPVNCDPPYTIGRNGHHVYKPECN